MDILLMHGEHALVLDRVQRDWLLETGHIYYCNEHSMDDKAVYHIEKGQEWFEVRVALEELRKENEDEVSSDR